MCQCATFGRYAWTIATCATCKKQIGWLFTARNKQLKPSSFWGIRSCQLAEEIRQNLQFDMYAVIYPKLSESHVQVTLHGYVYNATFLQHFACWYTYISKICCNSLEEIKSHLKIFLDANFCELLQRCCFHSQMKKLPISFKRARCLVKSFLVWSGLATPLAKIGLGE